VSRRRHDLDPALPGRAKLLYERHHGCIGRFAGAAAGQFEMRLGAGTSDPERQAPQRSDQQPLPVA